MNCHFNFDVPCALSFIFRNLYADRFYVSILSDKYYRDWFVKTTDTS